MDKGEREFTRHNTLPDVIDFFDFSTLLFDGLVTD
jgi:hypothetical protein